MKDDYRNMRIISKIIVIDLCAVIIIYIPARDALLTEPRLKPLDVTALINVTKHNFDFLRSFSYL